MNQLRNHSCRLGRSVPGTLRSASGRAFHPRRTVLPLAEEAFISISGDKWELALLTGTWSKLGSQPKVAYLPGCHFLDLPNFTQQFRQNIRIIIDIDDGSLPVDSHQSVSEMGSKSLGATRHTRRYCSVGDQRPLRRYSTALCPSVCHTCQPSASYSRRMQRLTWTCHGQCTDMVFRSL